MLKKLLLRVIKANNALEGRLLCWDLKRMCTGARLKKLLRLCVAAYEKMRILPGTAV